jgi:Tfp pilus assembly protein PilF
LARAQELLEAKLYSQARTLIDVMLGANQDTAAVRALGTRIACAEGADTEAQRYYAGMQAGKARDEVAAFCDSHGISLSTPAK